MSNQNVRSLFAMLRSNAAARYALSPALTGAGAVGTVLTTGAAAWGAYADLVVAAAIATEFWLCGVVCNTAAAIQIYEIQVASATPVVKMEVLFDPTAATLDNNLKCVPIPLYMPGGSAVQARAGAAAAKTINVQLLYAVGF